VNFRLTDLKTNSSQLFDFGLKYWPSYINYRNQHSGPYIFRPIDNLFYPFTYSELKNATISKGDVMSQIVLNYSKLDKRTGKPHMNAIVHIQLDADLAVVKFDVDLNSLPEIYLHGYEVVVSF